MTQPSLFKAVFNQPFDKYAEGAYTVFEVQQPFKHAPDSKEFGYSQIFAALWNGKTDESLLRLLEEAFISNALAPIVVIYEAHHCLYIIYTPHPDADIQMDIFDQWESLAKKHCNGSGSGSIITLDSRSLETEPPVNDYFDFFAPPIFYQHKLGLIPLSGEHRP